MASVQYIRQPPSVPGFLSARSVNLRNLVRWAKDEHQRWIIKCTKGGYYKYLVVLNEEYSPIRFLAEMHGFRNICSRITEYEWNNLCREDRKFITEAFKLREFLFRDNQELH
jgi:hypothetical protein